MKIHLAGSGHTHWIEKNFFDFHRLESFYYISKKEMEVIHKYENFMLDSGFVVTPSVGIKWNL